MLEIGRSHTIVHPRTVMVHATNATIANATVMRSSRFVGLTVTAHGVYGIIDGLSYGHSRGGYAAGIGERRLGVGTQCQRTDCAIDGRYTGRQVVVLCEQNHRQAAVTKQYPHSHGHEYADLVLGIHPDAVFGGSAGPAVPRFVVVHVLVGVFVTHGWYESETEFLELVMECGESFAE